MKYKKLIWFNFIASKLIVNDLEDYCKIINEASLTNRSKIDFDEVKKYTDLLNERRFRTDSVPGIIERLYAPKDTANPQEGERCFYTNENAKIIDNIRRTIDMEVPQHLKNVLLSILLYH